MTIALVLVVCFGVSMSGGVSTVLQNAKLGRIPDSDVTVRPELHLIMEQFQLFLHANTGDGYFGMPHVLLRFMATERMRTILRCPDGSRRYGS